MQDWDVISETWLFGVVENPIPARPLSTEAIPNSVSIGPEDINLSWRGDGKYFASVSRAQTGTCKAESMSIACIRPLVASCRNKNFWDSLLLFALDTHTPKCLPNTTQVLRLSCCKVMTCCRRSALGSPCVGA